MSEPFIAEIRQFAGNFAPRNWAFTNGQLLPIAQNTALFSLIGTIYGGDGRTTTGLPNLQGRIAMHPGNGPGLSSRRLGESGGAETHTLTLTEMTAHNHQLTQMPVRVSNMPGNSFTPEGNYWAGSHSKNAYSDDATSDLENSSPKIKTNSKGGGQSHTNLQPYLAVNYIIALVGVYPSRS